MFCPKCMLEFEEGVTECPDCGAPLVSMLPTEPEPDRLELETVLATGNPGTIAVAKSVLEAVGIQYIVRSETMVGLFAGLRIGAEANSAPGPVQFQVRKKDVEEAKKVLHDLEESDAED